MFDESARRDGTFSRADSTYDPEADAYVCPAGKLFRQRQQLCCTPKPLVDEDGVMRYRSSKLDCDARA